MVLVLDLYGNVLLGQVVELADSRWLGLRWVSQVVKALDAELTGKDWTPPPILEENILSERINEIPSEIAQLPPHVGDASLRRLSNGSARSSWDVGLLVWRILVEKFWYRASSRQLFLGRDFVVRLVERVKEEVKAETGGAEWVSTGDVLFAFAEKVSLPLYQLTLSNT